MSDSQFRLERHVSCSQLSLAAFSSSRATASQGPFGHGQRHCGRVRGVAVQVRDPADGLLGVLLAQLGVVGLSEGLEDAAACSSVMR